MYSQLRNCFSRKTKINASGGHDEMASRFRFLDKSKQRKPVKASEKADRRTDGRRGVEGGKEKGDLFRVRTRVRLRSNSQREARLDEAASPAECITNAFCVIR